jgi:hypothetical protein
MVGRRDFAILLLLSRLGLRASEVAAITLDDLDWRAGMLLVHGKGSREDTLPLPTDVGEAIVFYLRRRVGPREHGRQAARSKRDRPVWASRWDCQASRRPRRAGGALNPLKANFARAVLHPSRTSPQWPVLSIDLSMNSRPRVPAEASSDELVQANAHVAYSCGVNSKSHNPSCCGSK